MTLLGRRTNGRKESKPPIIRAIGNFFPARTVRDLNAIICEIRCDRKAIDCDTVASSLISEVYGITEGVGGGEPPNPRGKSLERYLIFKAEILLNLNDFHMAESTPVLSLK